MRGGAAWLSSVVAARRNPLIRPVGHLLPAGGAKGTPQPIGQKPNPSVCVRRSELHASSPVRRAGARQPVEPCGLAQRRQGQGGGRRLLHRRAGAGPDREPLSGRLAGPENRRHRALRLRPRMARVAWRSGRRRQDRSCRAGAEPAPHRAARHGARPAVRRWRHHNRHAGARSGVARRRARARGLGSEWRHVPACRIPLAARRGRYRARPAEPLVRRAQGLRCGGARTRCHHAASLAGDPLPGQPLAGSRGCSARTCGPTRC